MYIMTVHCIWRLVLVASLIVLLFHEASTDGACGGKLYDTEIDICCDGYIIHGGALGRWGCCGPKPYSLTRELCCNGTIRDVYNVETSNKRCCGSDVLGSLEGVCCNNQTFIGDSLCAEEKLWLLGAVLTSAVVFSFIVLCIWKKRREPLNNNYKNF